MKRRCYDPSNPSYERYGGSGVTVCDVWRDSYEAFVAHAGVRPSPQHTLDRIDNDGNYEPGNVRWATKEEQGTNRDTTHMLEFSGETLSIQQWSRRFALHPATIKTRLRLGWSIERTLTEAPPERYRSATRSNGGKQGRIHRGDSVVVEHP
jgi:hypothetical protein